MAERGFAIDQVVLTPDTPAVFIGHYEGLLSVEVGARFRDVWDRAWKQAGETRAPPLLLVDTRLKIAALSGAELKALGLMRIPAED